VVLRTCTVAVRDLRDVEHSIEVTAETLYEAIATALAALQQDNWVGEIVLCSSVMCKTAFPENSG
jgi:hypothetical protein